MRLFPLLLFRTKNQNQGAIGDKVQNATIRVWDLRCPSIQGGVCKIQTHAIPVPIRDRITYQGRFYTIKLGQYRPERQLLSIRVNARMRWWFERGNSSRFANR